MDIQKKDCFLLIGEPINFGPRKSYKINDEYSLRKANKHQVKLIRKALISLGGSRMLLTYYKNEPKVNGNQTSFEPLPYENWRYGIITHNNLQVDSNMIIALSLSDLDLHPIYENVNTGFSYQREKYNNFISDNSFGVKRIIDAEKINLVNINSVYRNICKIDVGKDKHADIWQALTDYQNINIIPSRSPLKIIAMISIIESLIVRSDENIAHQIGSKLSFINNYLGNVVDLSEYISGSYKQYSVIKIIYKYRSDIAHGSVADFNGGLKLIKNKENATEIVYRMLKMLLNFGIENPSFISDLKKI